MTGRPLAIAIILLAAQLGCGNSPGPSPDIDSLLVGTWVAQLRVSDPSGARCTVPMRVVLQDTGRFDWHVFEPISFADCENTRLTTTVGQWRAQAGSITFSPPPPVIGVDEPTLELSYELTGGGLRIGLFTFERG